MAGISDRADIGVAKEEELNKDVAWFFSDPTLKRKGDPFGLKVN